MVWILEQLEVWRATMSFFIFVPTIALESTSTLFIHTRTLITEFSVQPGCSTSVPPIHHSQSIVGRSDILNVVRIWSLWRYCTNNSQNPFPWYAGLITEGECCFNQLDYPSSARNTERKRHHYSDEKWELVEAVEYVLGVRLDVRRNQSTGVYSHIPVTGKYMHVPIQVHLNPNS